MSDQLLVSDVLNAMLLHLENGIIPFWLERSQDMEYGGFLTNFDDQGKSNGTPEKYINTQARLVWLFSALYRRFPKRDRYAELAKQGVDYILRYFWDEEYEGWYWKVKRDGTCLDDGKIVYGQSFAIYALTEYYLATHDARGLAYASRTFDLLQKYCTDTANGGYFENLERAWTVSEHGVRGGDRKGLDTHMHLMESFTNLFASSTQEIHRRKLLEIINLIFTRMVDTVLGCGRNQFDVNFQPVPAIAISRTWNAERQSNTPSVPADSTSFGHNVELAWLTLHALDTAKVDIAPYRAAILRLVDHAVQYGLDTEYGGVYRDGRANGEVLVAEKEWWQQAEALVGFLDAYRITGDEQFWDAFSNVWMFISQNMINADLGEWYTLLDRSGKPIVKQLGNEWKVAYHTGRSMLECTARLTQLDKHVMSSAEFKESGLAGSQ